MFNFQLTIFKYTNALEFTFLIFNTSVRWNLNYFEKFVMVDVANKLLIQIFGRSIRHFANFARINYKLFNSFLTNDREPFELWIFIDFKIGFVLVISILELFISNTLAYWKKMCIGSPYFLFIIHKNSFHYVIFIIYHKFFYKISR